MNDTFMRALTSSHAAGDAAAALYHHFALHDRVLLRMLPFAR
jgi:cytochrome b561